VQLVGNLFLHIPVARKMNSMKTAILSIHRLVIYVHM